MNRVVPDTDQGRTVITKIEESQFITQHLKRRECFAFKPVGAGKKDQRHVNDIAKCKCGYKKSEHNERGKVLGQESKWNSKLIKLLPTNAFGTVSLMNDTPKRYVRVDFKTRKSTILELFEKHWKLPQPNLIISVTGDTEDRSIATRLKTEFQKGLVNAAAKTGAWIITEGTNTGVMKYVGEAVNEVRMSSTTNTPLITIGITHWGSLKYQSAFIDDNGKWPAIYQIDTKEEDGGFNSLDQNHTHFIFVDDGKRHNEGAEFKFRAKLESEIMKTMKQKELGVSAVTIVLGGGINALQTVDQSLINDIPAIVIEDSGEMALVLSNAYQNVKKKPEDLVENDIKTDLENLKIEKRYAADVLKIVKKQRLLMFLKLLTPIDTPSNINDAILKILFKAKKGQEFRKLHLAMIWNNFEEVTKMPNYIWKEKENMAVMMTFAIEENRPEFVELFLAQGFDIQEFLTKEVKLQLYKKTEYSLFIALLGKVTNDLQQDYKLEDINMVYEYLTGYRLKTNSAGQINNAYIHLFLWGVLMNRRDMAKVFWGKGTDQIALALTACSMLNKMAADTSDYEQAQVLKIKAKEFNTLAINVLNDCFEINESNTTRLLLMDTDFLQNANCLSMAVKSDNKEFISQTVCRKLLKRLWMGKLSFWNSSTKILLSVIFPPIIISVTTDDLEKKERESKTDVRKTGNGLPEVENMSHGLENSTAGDDTTTVNYMNPFPKLFAFYTAPIVVFFHDIISYLVFLGYFSYILLVQLSMNFTRDDWILIAWVAMLFLEWLRLIGERHLSLQCGINYHSKVTSLYKIANFQYIYKSGIWIIADILAFLLFACGTSIRVIDTPEALLAARVILGISLMVFYFRSLHKLTIHRHIGPKIVMIVYMVKDLMYFMVILMIFVASYAIASYSILYPNSTLSLQLVMSVLRSAYWNLYGELFIDELERTEPECTFNPDLYNNGTLPMCPSEIGSKVVSVLLGIYVVFSNILLLNLLIAMFSYTFNRIHENTDEHWHFLRYSMICHYIYHSEFPPPIWILKWLFLPLKWLCCRYIPWCHKRHPSVRKPPTAKEEAKLKNWIKDVVTQYITKRKNEDNDSLERNAKATTTRLAFMSSKLDKMHKRVKALNKQRNEQIEELDTNRDYNTNEETSKLQKNLRSKEHIQKND